ncbi:serine/threonine phosphatase [Egbenema bharatensis]|uniref:serine/threonine phosphatase n=1 Tax=Egbenema bharatensis TaxID=3463334 RepID=UPI003A87334F
MLVCPHCQFENPDTNKFCQQCGGVLTGEVSPTQEQPLQMAAPAEKNESTGEYDFPNDQIRLGIVARQISAAQQINPQPEEASPGDPAAPPVAPAAMTAEAETEALVEGPIAGVDQITEMGELNQAVGQPDADCPSPIAAQVKPEEAIEPEEPMENGYLDQKGRYQLLNPLPELRSDVQEFEIHVLDHQPLQATVFQNLNYQQEPSVDAIEPPIHPAAIPHHARPYLELQQTYPSLRLPELHDAWEQDGYSITLLKHPVNLPLLVDICQDETILPLQILYWLHEMVEYWAVLQPYHQCQSLLKLDNLQIDPEDCVLCLRRLYTDAPEALPTLSHLGSVWQKLFEQSQRTQPGDLFLLCRDLESGTLSSVDELRLRIEKVAERLQHLVEPSTLETNSSTTAFTAEEPDAASSIALEEIGENDGQSTDLSESLMGDGDDQPTIVLPMQLISIDDAGRTITGRQRDHNEDSFYIQTEVKRVETKKLDESQERVVQAKGLYILCDGMGGHAGGEVASALAVETLRKYFEEHWQDSLPNEQSIREAIYLANQAIYDQNQTNSRMGSGRMGTTLVLLLLHNADVAIAHVGDSRLYRLSRRRGLEQLTVDHEVGQREIQRGVEPTIAYARPDAYQLTQALAPEMKDLSILMSAFLN